MSWFPVDDAFHTHPKARKAGFEAIGLWCVSGSFCMAYLTDGFVPEWFIKEKPKGMLLAQRLVSADLWEIGEKDGEQGFYFHDWKVECTKSHVTDVREKARQRQLKSRESRRESRVTDGVTDGVTHAFVTLATQPNPTQPISTLVTSNGEVTSANARAPDPPPRYCPDHMPNGTLDRCGACADARRTHDRWLTTADLATKQAAQAQARAEAQQRGNTATTRALAIAGCELCDEDGYTPNRRVCDHQNHADTNKHGMTKVRASMGWTTGDEHA